MKYRLLDLFCGAGGCSMGYHQAGFEVVGVDLHPMKRYPFEFHRADALEYVAAHGQEFDVIHASPPCQGYSVTKHLATSEYPLLVEDVRALLLATGKPYVIENVVGAPLDNPLLLCGTMFGLRVRRHRLFECRPPIWFPPGPCQCKHQRTSTTIRRRKNLTRSVSFADGVGLLTVVGNDYLADEGRAAMGIDWMVREELSESIPPAYTEFIGREIMCYLENKTPD